MTDSPPPDDGSDHVSATQATEIAYEFGTDELPSEAVVRATATLTDTPVIALDPLFDVVDPDHLDGLFGDGERRPLLDERSVTFAFNGWHVSVTGEDVVVRATGQTTG